MGINGVGAKRYRCHGSVRGGGWVTRAVMAMMVMMVMIAVMVMVSVKTAVMSMRI